MKERCLRLLPSSTNSFGGIKGYDRSTDSAPIIQCSSISTLADAPVYSVEHGMLPWLSMSLGRFLLESARRSSSSLAARSPTGRGMSHSPLRPASDASFLWLSPVLSSSLRSARACPKAGCAESLYDECERSLLALDIFLSAELLWLLGVCCGVWGHHLLRTQEDH